MSISPQIRWWFLPCAIVLVMLIGPLGRQELPGAAAQEACAPGLVQADTVSLGTLILSQGASPYSSMTLSRITLAPGESLELPPGNPVVYYVESGVLKYQFQRWLSINVALRCVPEDGPLTIAGTTTVDGDNMVIVGQGQSVIAEGGVEGPIINGGTTPLVVLQMTITAPELDPASGLPIVDPAFVAREQSRAFEARKRACRMATRDRNELTGTPTDAAAMAASQDAPLATPAVSTAGWANDIKHPARQIPRVCQEP